MGSHTQRLALRRRRIIYNDDFETQIWGRKPKSAQELYDIFCEVRDTAVTTYAVKVCEYDNKNYYVGNKKGIDWSQIDFLSFGERWRDYHDAAAFLRQLHEEGRPAFQVCIDACRDMGIRCTATFRMNDWHGAEPLDLEGSADISFWLKQHPQYAIREPVTGRIMRLAMPLRRRPEARGEEGVHIFMLVEADAATAASALVCGENVLGVTLKKRRDGAVLDASVNELEIIVAAG